MGAADCTGKDSTDACWNSDQFCIQDGSNTGPTLVPGDNCMYCGTSPDGNSVSAPNKPTTCCLDPSVNSSSTYQLANAAIQKALQSNVISYYLRTYGLYYSWMFTWFYRSGCPTSNM